MDFLSIFCCIPRNRHQNSGCHGPSQAHSQYQSPPPLVSTGPNRRSLSDRLEELEGQYRYSSDTPLPKYTPRPTDTVDDEKPPAFDSLSHRQSYEYPLDEKTPLDYQIDQARTNYGNDRASDASSAFSFPSTFGNTSTATGETPPPPYSLRSSRAPSRRSMSISASLHSPEPIPAPSELPSPIPEPQPALRRSVDSQRTARPSSESQHGRVSGDGPPLPPVYTRR